MFSNSLVGVNQLVGESFTLKHMTAQSYSTATGKPTPSFTNYVVRGHVRSMTVADRTRLGTELVREATAIVVIPLGQLPAEIVPAYRDEIVTQGQTWEILRVLPFRSHGRIIEYQCQVHAH